MSPCTVWIYKRSVEEQLNVLFKTQQSPASNFSLQYYYLFNHKVTRIKAIITKEICLDVESNPPKQYQKKNSENSEDNGGFS